jgi:hypothetical protein
VLIGQCELKMGREIEMIGDIIVQPGIIATLIGLGISLIGSHGCEIIASPACLRRSLPVHSILRLLQSCS